MQWLAVKEGRRNDDGKATALRREEPENVPDGHHYQHLRHRPHQHQIPHSLRTNTLLSLPEFRTGGLPIWDKLQAGYFVIMPRTSCFLPIWDTIIATLIVFCAWAVPYEVGFMLLLRPTDKVSGGMVQREESGANGMLGLQRTTTMIDALFFFDMALQLVVSYPHATNRRWIRRPGKIVEAYVRGHFIIDLISVLPYERLTFFLEDQWGEPFRLSGLLSLLMLLRMLRVSRMIERYESRVDIDYSFINMVSLMITLFLTVHWGACFWGFIVGAEWFFNIEVGNTWYDSMLANKPVFFQKGLDQNPIADGGWSLYIASLYWSAMTVTSIGYGDITAMNRIEAVSTTAFMLIGGVIWAHIIGNVCAIASSFSAGKAAYESQMDSLNEMMRSLHLHQDLKVELREYFMRRRLLYHREKQVELLRSMSPELQEKVARSVQERVLKVWFFRDIKDSGFLVGLFERFLYQVYPPRELIKLGHSLCNLREGMALRGYRIQFPGDIWGEAELLLSNANLLEDVLPVPLSYLEVQYLTRDNLDALTVHYPTQRRIIQKAAAWMALRRAVLSKWVKPSWSAQLPEQSERKSILAGGVAELRRRMTAQELDEDMGGGETGAETSGLTARHVQEVRETRMKVLKMESTQEEVFIRVSNCERSLDEVLSILRTMRAHPKDDARKSKTRL